MFFGKNRSLTFNFISRITLWYLSIYGLTFFVLIFLANHFLNQSFEEKSREILRSQAHEYAAWFEEGGLQALKARFNQRKEETSEAFFIRVVGFLGNALFIRFPDGHENLNTEILNNTISGDQSTFLTVESKKQGTYWKVFSYPLSSGTVVQVGRDVSQEKAFQNRLKDILLNLSLPFLILGLLGGIILTTRAVKPIRRLTTTLKDILATGQLDKRVPVNANRQALEELVVLFNRLMDENQKLIERMHGSLDAVAHDLRTPIARLRAAAEMAESGDQNIEAYREALSDCLEESERILAMLNVFMDVTEAESGAMKLRRENIDLPQLINSIFDLYEIPAEEAGVVLIYSGPEHLQIRADPIRLQQAVLNLIDNAVKYIGKGSRIEVSLEELDTHCKLVVRDDGIGMREQDLTRIWERLYRIDASRSQKGLGLGLSFVKAIIEAHGGNVSVESELGKGSTFVLDLPKAGLELSPPPTPSSSTSLFRKPRNGDPQQVQKPL